MIRKSTKKLVVLAACAYISACSLDDSSGTSGTPPGLIADFTSDVLNENEIRISWSAATDAENDVVGYNVYRDGVAVALRVAALSYVDTSLQPSTTYTFSVQAVDAAGNTGGQLSIVATTSEAGPAAITSENFGQVAQLVFSAYSGALYQDGLSDARNIPDSYSAESVLDDSGFIRSNYTCSNGGTASSRAQSGHSEFLSVETDNCQLDSAIYNGQVIFSSKGGRVFDQEYENYQSETQAGLSTEINGTYRTEEFVCSSDNRKSRITANFNWLQSSSSGTVFLSAASTQYSVGDLCGSDSLAFLSGSLAINSEVTGGKTVQANIVTPFNNTENNFNFPTGELLITSADGSSMRIVADNGDPNTVLVTVESEPGQSESFTEQWSSINGPLQVGEI